MQKSKTESNQKEELFNIYRKFILIIFYLGFLNNKDK